MDLLPTPTARDHKGAVSTSTRTDLLPDAVKQLHSATKLLPTPQAKDGTSGRANPETVRRGRRKSGTPVQIGLREALFELVHSSPVSAGSTSASTPPSDASPPGSARSTSTPSPSCNATGRTCRCCPTSGTPTRSQQPDTLTCCTADTPANPSATQASEEATLIPVIFGPPCWQPFAFFDPASWSVRTSQGTLLSDSTECLVTLPRWGTACGGALYGLPTPGLLTSGHGSSGLLGTPNSHENDMGAGKTPQAWDEWTDRMREAHGNGNGHGKSLSIEAQRLLPTPSASDNTGGEGATRAARQESGQTGGPMLRDVAHLLPTPMSATYDQGGDGGELRAAIQHGPTRRLLPTPTSQAAKHGETPDLTAQGSGYNLWDLPRLLPTHRSNATRSSRKSLVENQQWSAPSLEQALEISQGILPREFKSWDEVPAWSGASTSPPSEGGSTPPDSRPPGQLTIEDA